MLSDLADTTMLNEVKQFVLTLTELATQPVRPHSRRGRRATLEPASDDIGDVTEGNSVDGVAPGFATYWALGLVPVVNIL